MVHHLIDWLCMEGAATVGYLRQDPMKSMLNLYEQGVYTKSGTISIVDTSVIETKQCRLHKD